MIKVSVFYTNQPGKHFDIDYYCTKRIPMVRQLCGPTLLNAAVEQGVAGATAGAPPSFLAMSHLYFETVDAFQSALAHTPDKSSRTSPITPTSSPPSKSAS